MSYEVTSVVVRTEGRRVVIETPKARIRLGIRNAFWLMWALGTSIVSAALSALFGEA